MPGSDQNTHTYTVPPPRPPNGVLSVVVVVVVCVEGLRLVCEARHIPMSVRRTAVWLKVGGAWPCVACGVVWCVVFS